VTAARRALPLAVALLAAAAFLPALDAGFVDWDDDRNFLDNPRYRGLGWAELRWMFTATWMGHYIPLTWLTLGLNHALGGMNPAGYHLGNLLLHAANAALFYLLARRLLAIATTGVASDGSRAVTLGAAAAALVWALHPLRVESVAWITERRDVLCGLFYLLAVLAYVRGVEAAPGARGRWRIASLVGFAAALGAKGMAMTLPASLLILDFYPLRRARLGWRALVVEKIPYLALAALGAAVAAWAVTRGAAWTPYETHGLGARLAMTAYGFWFYPSRMVWPEGLSPLYELPARIDPLAPGFLAPIAAVLGASLLLLLLRGRFPGGLAAWAHSLVVVAPVSGIAHAGYQLAHDRYSYLSTLGFALLFGGGVAWIARQRARGRISRVVAAAAGAAAVLALAGLAAGSWAQTEQWRDSESLWRAAVAADPACALCRHKLGNVLLAARRHGEARTELERAIALRPERPGPRVSLGALLVETGRLAEAEAALREAMRLGPRLGDAPANLGALYARQGRNAEAIAHLRRAVALAPWMESARDSLARALGNRGAELAQAGRFGAAAAHFAEAATLRPDDAALVRSHGQALLDQGRPAEALAPLERAAALAPRGASERFWLARGYRLAGRDTDADRQIALLRELDPAAAALAERGETPPAR